MEQRSGRDMCGSGSQTVWVWRGRISAVTGVGREHWANFEGSGPCRQGGTDPGRRRLPGLWRGAGTLAACLAVASRGVAGGERRSVFHATGLVHVLGTLTGSCGATPGIACRLTWDITHSMSAAQVVQIYLAGPASPGVRM